MQWCDELASNVIPKVFFRIVDLAIAAYDKFSWSRRFWHGSEPSPVLLLFPKIADSDDEFLKPCKETLEEDWELIDVESQLTLDEFVMSCF